MTRKEAIEILRGLKPTNTVSITDAYNTGKALTMAIASLETYEAYQLEYERTTKNNLGVNFIDREMAIEGAWDTELAGLDNIKIVNMLKDLPSVTPQESRWIPVSERLPKAGEYIGNVERYYLVQNEYGDMLVARYPHSGYWEQIYQPNPIGDEIVAWMPLPTPYEPQESEDI